MMRVVLQVDNNLELLIQVTTSDVSISIGADVHAVSHENTTSQTSRGPGRPRKVETLSPRPIATPQPVLEGPSAEPGVSSPQPEIPLPIDLYQLPRKHQQFFARKLAEFREIYPEERARELALEAVRGIAGLSNV